MTDSGICGMAFLRIKNLTSKNLPKTSETFTIVINLAPSNDYSEGVLLRPWTSSIYRRKLQGTTFSYFHVYPYEIFEFHRFILYPLPAALKWLSLFNSLENYQRSKIFEI